MKVRDIFHLNVAKSKGTDDYELGDVPFITNSEINNGVVKYVEPFDGDKIFRGPAICISGLGHATVQLDAFLPKGNGGDSCTILVPKLTLKITELIYYAALFNTLHGWRFSFGRKASRRRLSDLDLAPVHDDPAIAVDQEIEKNNNRMLTLLRLKEAELKKAASEEPEMKMRIRHGDDEPSKTWDFQTETLPKTSEFFIVSESCRLRSG